LVAGAFAVVIHDVGMWWRRDRPLPQLTFLAAAAVAVGTGVAELTSNGPAGLVVWTVGAVVGGSVVTEDGPAVSMLLSTSTAMALLALASIRRLPTNLVEQRMLAIVGGIALLSGAPGTIGDFSEQAALVTGLVVWTNRGPDRGGRRLGPVASRPGVVSGLGARSATDGSAR
jgi:hypothetical protein